MIRLTVAERVEVSWLPPSVIETVRKGLTLKNPAYATRRRLGKWTGDIPETLTLIEQEAWRVFLPRGYLSCLLEMIRAAGEEFEIVDNRLRLPDVLMSFTGELREYQARAVDETKRCGSGVLVGPCGCGKTVMGCALVNDNYTSPSTTITLPQTGTRRNYRSGALETRFCACFPDILSA